MAAKRPQILKHLHVFLAVAEEGQVKRAAARLHIAQSAVSRRIRSLESELGVQLFERRPEGAFLTPAGRNLREVGQTIVNLTDRAVEHARSSALGEVGALRVGYIEMALRQPRVAAAIRKFRQEAPGVELSLIPMWSTEQARQLKIGAIDAGLMHRTGDEGPELEAREMFSQQLLLALPKKHPLAKNASLRLKDLAHEDLIVPRREQSPRLVDRLMSDLHAAGVRPRISTEITTSETLVYLVASGMGVGFVDEMRRDYLPRDVTLRPVSDFSHTLRMDVVWGRQHDNAALRRFLDVMPASGH